MHCSTLFRYMFCRQFVGVLEKTYNMHVMNKYCITKFLYILLHYFWKSFTASTKCTETAWRTLLNQETRLTHLFLHCAGRNTDKQFDSGDRSELQVCRTS